MCMWQLWQWVQEPTYTAADLVMTAGLANWDATLHEMTAIMTYLTYLET